MPLTCMNSLLSACLKFLKASSTTVMLSSVLYATEAFMTCSTTYPHVWCIGWSLEWKFFFAAIQPCFRTSALLILSKIPSPRIKGVKEERGWVLTA